MSLEVDAERFAAGPLLQRAPEGGQQYVVYLGAIARWHALQQRLCFLARQVALNRPGFRLHVLAVAPRLWKHGHWLTRLGEPIGQGRNYLRRLGELGETGRPNLIRRGFGGQHWLLASEQAEISGFKILAYHSPRYPVHCNVMDHEQQPAPLPGTEGKMHGAQQGPVRKIEARLSLCCVTLDRVRPLLNGGVRKIDASDCERNILAVFLYPIGSLQVHAQPERIVTANYPMQRLLEDAKIDILGQFEEKSLVPMGALCNILLKKPALDGRELHGSGHLFRRNIGRGTTNVHASASCAMVGRSKRSFGVRRSPAWRHRETT